MTTDIRNKKCVDFHAHPVTDLFRNSVSELGIDVIEEDGFPLPAWSVDDQLRFMETAGIDFSVLSAPSPHLYNGDGEKSARVVRRVNFEASEIVKTHSDKLAFVGTVPLPDAYSAIVETAYVLDILGAVGLKVATNMGGVYLGDPAFDPVLEEWNKRKALVIIHPCRARLRPENSITGRVAAIYEYPADTTRAVLNMIANRVMTRFPNIDWVVPHCGSFLPYMLQRFAGVTGILAALDMMETVDAKSEFERLYFDIAGDPEPTHLEMLRMVAADDRILYGTDFPHSPAKIVVAKKQHFDANPKYDGIREQIYAENARNLLLKHGDFTAK